AKKYEREYLRDQLTASALKTYPLDPADDPGFFGVSRGAWPVKCLRHTSSRSGSAALTDSNSDTANGMRGGQSFWMAGKSPQIRDRAQWGIPWGDGTERLWLLRPPVFRLISRACPTCPLPSGTAINSTS